MDLSTPVSVPFSAAVEANAIDAAGLSKRFRFPALRKQATIKDLVVGKIRREGDHSVVDALVDVTFSVGQGQMLGVIGSNGSGKSTLLRVLAGIMKPDRGELRIRGSVAPLLTVGSGFSPHLTGRENAIVELLTLGLSREDARRSMDDVIVFSELAEFIDAPLRTYSAGMTMRLAFAAAICVDPDILMIDEILAVGDAQFSAKCALWLRDFRARGKTMVLVTHETATVARDCDVALWLQDGRVEAFGDPARTVRAYLRASTSISLPEPASLAVIKHAVPPVGRVCVACGGSNAYDQLRELRSRLLLRLSGPVGHASISDGVYDDAWTNGSVTFSVLPIRNVTGFTLRGVIPQRMPEGATIEVRMDGSLIASRSAEPGAFSIKCSVPLQRGIFATIGITTSATVCYKDEGVSDDSRRLGLYINDIAFEGSDPVPFTCNICGTGVSDLQPDLDPESSTCTLCGSTVRLRMLVHLLSSELHGRSTTAPDWPPQLDVKVLGISDWPLLRRFLAPVVGYVSTQFDSDLLADDVVQLDVTNPPAGLAGSADFVICSEVLEHVEPPVQRGFDGLYALLKPGGTLVFTVPYGLDATVEHFPNLYDWHIDERDGQRVLVNRTRDGSVEEFANLRFHGGGEDVLEMRAFGLADLIAHLELAGFVDVRVRQEHVLDFGICCKYNWALPITARRPKTD